MRILLVLIFILSNIIVKANLVPYRDGSKFGYVDLEGNVIVKATLERAFPFRDGLGRFKYKGHYGYMNEKGHVVINNVYKNAWDFSDGMAKICEGLRCAFINKAGQEVFKVIGAEEVGDFSEGLCIFKKMNKYGYFDKTGKIVVDAYFTKAENFQNGYARVSSDAKQGLLKNNGKFALFPIYDFVGVPNNDRVRVRVGGRWNVYSTNGNLVKQVNAKITGDFSDGYAVIERRMPSRIIWSGYIDSEGNEVIEPQFVWAGAFVNGVAVVKKDNLYGVINKEGEWVVEPKFQSTLGEFSDFKLGVKFEGKWGFIDTRGNWIIKPKYFDVDNYYKGYAMVANQNRLWGAIDMDGKLIVPTEYELIIPEQNFLIAYAGIMKVYFLTNGKILWADKDEEEDE